MAELVLTQNCGVSIILSFYTLSAERDTRDWRWSQEQTDVLAGGQNIGEEPL